MRNKDIVATLNRILSSVETLENAAYQHIQHHPEPLDYERLKRIVASLLPQPEICPRCGSDEVRLSMNEFEFRLDCHGCGHWIKSPDQNVGREWANARLTTND